MSHNQRYRLLGLYYRQHTAERFFDAAPVRTSRQRGEDVRGPPIASIHIRLLFDRIYEVADMVSADCARLDSLLRKAPQAAGLSVYSQLSGTKLCTLPATLRALAVAVVSTAHSVAHGADAMAVVSPAHPAANWTNAVAVMLASHPAARWALAVAVVPATNFYI